MTITVQPEHDGLRLDRVLANEVAALQDSHGFEHAPARISRLMRAPLMRATSKNRKGVLVKQLKRPTAELPT